jgi:arsenate reductase
MKRRILFLCTNNSSLSQMAEGLANHFLGGKFQAFSAGPVPKRVTSLTIKVLGELDIDISHQRSKSIDTFGGQSFDSVVSLCTYADDKFPLSFNGVRLIHQKFDDPSQLNASEEELLPEYRRVREEIRAWVDKSFGQIA